MTSKADLVESSVFSGLSADMLEKLASIAEDVSLNERQVVFREGDVADKFYVMKRGKVLLEQQVVDKMSVTVDTIKPGESFGIGSVMNDGLYKLSAICAEPCDLIVWSTDDLKAALEADNTLGFIVLKNVIGILKKRLDRRTEQFVRSIRDLPEIAELGMS